MEKKMKTTETIKKLQESLEKHGDCEIVVLSSSGTNIHEIQELEFIGGNRLLIKTNTPREKLIRKIYIHHEKERNKQRKKEWQEDCK